MADTSVFRMVIEDVFSTGAGPVITGRVQSGVLHAGDEIEIVTQSGQHIVTCAVRIQMFTRTLEMASPGDSIGVLLRDQDVAKDLQLIFRGGLATEPGAAATGPPGLGSVEPAERAQSNSQPRNPTYEQHLKSELGVDHGEGGWAFEGGTVVDDMVAQFSDPDICLGVLKGIRAKLPFSQICIVASPRMVVLVCNTKPTPTCFVTGLDTSGIGSLVAAATKEGAKAEMHENGPWLLTL